MRLFHFVTGFLLIALLVAGNARAALIDNGDFTTDDVSGLDWLDLSLTDGMTFALAEATYAGWSLASSAQFAGLIAQFDTPGDDNFMGQPSNPETVFGGVSLATALNSNYASNPWFDLFGLTVSGQAGGVDTLQSLGYYDEGGIRRRGGVAVWDYADSTGRADEGLIYFDDGVDFSDPIRDGAANFGWFLVRGGSGPDPDPKPDPVPVPEPSLALLLVTGLAGFGLAGLRRREA